MFISLRPILFELFKKKLQGGGQMSNSPPPAEIGLESLNISNSIQNSFFSSTESFIKGAQESFGKYVKKESLRMANMKECCMLHPYALFVCSLCLIKTENNCVKTTSNLYIA